MYKIRNPRLLSLILVTLALTSCASNNPPISNIISIGSAGTPINPATDKVFSDDEFLAHIDKVLSFDEEEVVVYIHGGLNTPRSANQRALELKTPMQEDKTHPIFVHWRSGFFTTYTEHLLVNRQGEQWNAVGWGGLTSPFIVLADLGRAISRFPMTWWYKTNSAVKVLIPGIYPSERDAIRVATAAAISADFAELPALTDYRPFTDRFMNNANNTLQLAGGLLTAPFFDAGGTGAWDIMKRRTGVMFVKGKPRDEDTFDSFEQYSDLRKGALARFLDALTIRQQNDPALKITLVGHSMGTIIANEIVRGWPQLHLNSIIYMGAASSIDDFRETVIPYMQMDEHLNTCFYNFMLHPIAENSEGYGPFGIGGTGSLLNQIDHIFEKPVIESDRTLGRWVNAMSGLNYFDESIRDRVHMRTMPLGADYPMKHTDFANVDYLATGQFWRGNLGQRRIQAAPGERRYADDKRQCGQSQAS